MYDNKKKNGGRNFQIIGKNRVHTEKEVRISVKKSD